MTLPPLLGVQEAHEGMDLNRTLTSLLGSLVIWGAVAGVCLWFLDYRSLFRGGYELVTFRHVQLGLAAFSGWRALEALRELLVPPELDSPVRRWTRWIPLTWLSLPMCLASLLAMLYFPEALAEAGRSRPTSSYKSHPLLPPFFMPLAQVNRVFLPLFKTRKVPITIVLVGYRLVIFFDTPLHLLKKSLF